VAAVCKVDSKEYMAFQRYSLALSYVVTPLPSSVWFVDGVTIPLCFATAAHGLYGKGNLDLALPSPSAAAPARKGEKLLVWAGSTCVGMFAIQLAARAGYTVVATASPHNHALLLSFGAAAVFDRTDPDVVAMITAEFGKEWVGAYLISFF
jgi:NADPH:quinone reductase-like Zn-dependent oxidoreductase